MISSNSEGYDVLYVAIKDPNMIDILNAVIPPFLEKSEFESVKSKGEAIVKSVNSSFVISILIQMVIGGILSKIIAVFQTLQVFNIILMLEY